MVWSSHDPAWPDKVVFAGLTLVMAGTAGLAFVALQSSAATVRELVPGILSDIPRWLTALLCAATAVFGGLAVRHQAAAWALLGCAAGVASLGVYGLVPLLSLVSLGFLVAAWREGEETVHDERRVAPEEWPDKAFIASALLLAAGVLTLFQGVLILADRFQPALLGDLPAAAGAWSLLAGLVALWGARECYRLRRAWAGAAAALAALLGLGFYVIGPGLGLAALELLRRADREQEFEAGAVA